MTISFYRISSVYSLLPFLPFVVQRLWKIIEIMTGSKNFFVLFSHFRHSGRRSVQQQQQQQQILWIDLFFHFMSHTRTDGRTDSITFTNCRCFRKSADIFVLVTCFKFWSYRLCSCACVSKQVGDIFGDTWSKRNQSSLISISTHSNKTKSNFLAISRNVDQFFTCSYS